MELISLTNICDITYVSELILDILMKSSDKQNVKGQIRTNKEAIQRRILDICHVKDVLI